MKYLYKGQIVTANSKEEAKKIVAATSKEDAKVIKDTYAKLVNINLNTMKEMIWDVDRNKLINLFGGISKIPDCILDIEFLGRSLLNSMAESIKYTDEILALPKNKLIKKDSKGDFPAYIIAMDFGNRKEVSKKLLSLPLDILKVKDEATGMTILHYIIGGVAEIKAEDIKKIPIKVLSIKENNGETALHFGAGLYSKSAKEIASLPKEFLMIKNSDGDTVLDNLAENHSFSWLKKYVSKNINIDKYKK